MNEKSEIWTRLFLKRQNFYTLYYTTAFSLKIVYIIWYICESNGEKGNSR